MAKPVKGGKTPSIRSRAARRAASPSLNTDKSLKNAKPPPSSNAHIFLSSRLQDGITKSRKSSKQSTRAQKARRAAAIERAEAFSEQTATKIARSEGRQKTVRERRKDWEDVNGERKKKSDFEKLKMAWDRLEGDMELDGAKDGMAAAEHEVEDGADGEADTSPKEQPEPLATVKDADVISQTSRIAAEPEVKLPDDPPPEDEIL